MGTCHGIWMTKHVILVMLAISLTRVAGELILPSSSGAGRVLTESSLDETVRVDPLNHLKKYRGGFNVTNDHYWSSTVFTGISGYGVALICLLCGLGYGILLLIKTRGCKSSRNQKSVPSCNEKYHLEPLLLAIFFTLLAVGACGLAFGGNSKSHSRAKTVINIILDTAEDASSTLYNITGAMKEISSNLKEVDANANATKLIVSTTQKIETQAYSIKTHASKNRHLSQKALKTSYAVTTVMIALTVVVVITLLACGVLKFQRPLQVLISLCWMLLVLCWLYFGICAFLQNLIGDTCRALDGFQKNPYNSSLSRVLPCQELLGAKATLNNASAQIYNLVNKVNVNISTSYGNVVQICNPFSPPPAYEYQPWNCPDTAVRIGDIPKVLKQLACPDSQTTCTGGILVPAKYYKTVGAYCTSIQILLDQYSSIKGLVECRPVKDALSEILNYHCKPLKRNLRLLRSALLFLSLVLVALVLIWAVRAHHDQTHHSSGGSIKPQYAGIIESGVINHTNDHSEDGPDT